MKNRFQLRRFGHLLTWTLYGHKGQLLTTLASLTAIFFVAMALTVWTQRDNPAWAREGAYYQITAFCVFIASSHRWKSSRRSRLLRLRNVIMHTTPSK